MVMSMVRASDFADVAVYRYQHQNHQYQNQVCERRCSLENAGTWLLVKDLALR
jgi:hypothetical protein